MSFPAEDVVRPRFMVNFTKRRDGPWLEKPKGLALLEVPTTGEHNSFRAGKCEIGLLDRENKLCTYVHIYNMKAMFIPR